MTRMFLITALAIFVANVAIAQDNSELPTLAFPMLNDSNVHVPDAGFVRHRSRPRTSREILAWALPEHMNNSVCSKRVVDGSTTFDIIHDGKPLEITIDENGKIEMQMIRRYTLDTLDQLKSEHPEFAETVSDFPKAIDKNRIVAFSLDIEVTVSAKNADELKSSHPDVHAIFERYTKPTISSQSKSLRVVEESK